MAAFDLAPCTPAENIEVAESEAFIIQRNTFLDVVRVGCQQKRQCSTVPSTPESRRWCLESLMDQESLAHQSSDRSVEVSCTLACEVVENDPRDDEPAFIEPQHMRQCIEIPSTPEFWRHSAGALSMSEFLRRGADEMMGGESATGLLLEGSVDKLSTSDSNPKCVPWPLDFSSKYISESALTPSTCASTPQKETPRDAVEAMDDESSERSLSNCSFSQQNRRRQRPDRNQRHRYRKFVNTLMDQIKENPLGIDVHNMHFNPCVVESDALKRKLLKRLEAYRGQLLQELKLQQASSP
jgi:hypothetical protein